MALLQRSIPTVSGLSGKLARRVDIDGVVDSFLSTLVNVPLSANRGRLLESKKAERLDIVDNLESDSLLSPLSANQGSILDGLIQERLETNSVYDGLDSSSVYDALSAKQGKVLSDLIILRTNGVSYGGAVSDVSSHSYQNNTFYVVSQEGTISSLNYYVYPGDMIVVGQDGDMAVVDSSESEDILRESNKTQGKEDISKVVTGAVAILIVADAIEVLMNSIIEMVVDKDVTVTGDTFELSRTPKNGLVVSSMAYITKPDGTYDEYDLVSVSGKTVTLIGAGGAYDGMLAKASYFSMVAEGTPSSQTEESGNLDGMHADTTDYNNVVDGGDALTVNYENTYDGGNANGE